MFRRRPGGTVVRTRDPGSRAGFPSRMLRTARAPVVGRSRITNALPRYDRVFFFLLRDALQASLFTSAEYRQHLIKRIYVTIRALSRLSPIHVWCFPD
jgi:hypothetical protein